MLATINNYRNAIPATMSAGMFRNSVLEKGIVKCRKT